MHVQASRLVSISLTFSCTVLCFALEMHTVITFRSFTAQNKVRYKDDFRLLGRFRALLAA